MKKLSSTIITSVLFCTLIMFNNVTTLSAGPVADAKDKLLEDWQRAKEYTKEYLDAMPEEGVTFKPNPEVRSFAAQMLHIAGANFAFASAAAGKQNPYQGKNLEDVPEFTTKEGLTKMVMESYDFIINSLKDIDPDRLDENIQLFNREMSRERAFAKAFEHQTHHRGQTTMYLRLKGITPPAEKLF